MGCSRYRIHNFLLFVYAAFGTVNFSDAQTCLATRNNLCYFLPNAVIPWQNASATCASQGATLPIIRDSATQTFVKNLLTPGGTEDVWLALSGTPGDWYYVADKSKVMKQGCYKDLTFRRDLNGHTTTNDSMVPDMCLTICSGKSFTYAGVSDKNTCNCGNSYGTYGMAIDNKCTVSCAGNETLHCGGFGSNDVYLINGAYSNWGYQQPLNGTCAALQTEASAREFVSLACTSSIRHICQINTSPCPTSSGYTTVEGVCIYMSSSSATWSAAREACKSINGDLVKVKDATFMASLRNILVGQGSSVDMYWIGLTKYTWKFTDGQEPTYLPWANGQPSLITSSCAAMSKASAYSWINEDCTKNLNVLCAKDTTTTTTESPTTTTAAPTTQANQVTTATDNENNNSGNNGNNSGNTGNNSGSPSSGASTSGGGSGLKGYQIAIILALVVLCIVIVVVIVLVIWQKKKSNNNGRVSPDSMARNSPIPSETNDNDTAGLVVTDHNMFNARSGTNAGR